MGKKSIVIKTIEEKLSPYGFHYTKYESGRWTFSREVDGVIQNAIIQKGMWRNNYYLLEINTSVSPALLRMSTFAKNSGYQSDFFEFHNEVERREVLEILGDIVIQYGIDKMKELSVAKEHYETTPEMHKKLMREQEILTREFMERHGLNSSEEEAVMLAIKEELKAVFDQKYEQVQDKLVELAAVYGNMLILRMGGKWGYSKCYKTTGVEKIPLFVNYPVLKFMVGIWSKKDENLVIKEYGNDVRYFLRWVADCRRVYGPDWEPPSLVK